MQSQRATSSQNRDAEKRSAITTDPPAASTQPGATTPPTLWNSGRQSYMRSSGPSAARPANQRLQVMIRRWLTTAALGRPVVPDV